METKSPSKVIIIERTKLASLIKLYRKSLYMIRILAHICADKNLDNMTFLKEEICELLELTPEQLQKAKEDGEIRFYEMEGIDYFEMSDMLRLKMGLDMESIYRQLDEMSLIPRIWKKTRPKAIKIASAKANPEKTSSKKK